MSEKLQKVLARAGVGSRRKMEEYIQEGRVKVNDKVAELGLRVEAEAVIHVDGRKINWRTAEETRTRVLLYNKPEGEICSRSDPEGRPTVFDKIPTGRGSKWISVGRLDFNTTGLLLFTNNGELANKLMHPSQEIEREYAVRILGEVSTAMLKKLKSGVQLEDGLAAFTSIREAGGEGANRWYHVVLKEGRNREVRRLWEAMGVKVSRLIRIRFADIQLPKTLRRGSYKELDRYSVKLLEDFLQPSKN